MFIDYEYRNQFVTSRDVLFRITFLVPVILMVVLKSRCLSIHTTFTPRNTTQHHTTPHHTYYTDVTMTTMASQITSLTVVYPIVYSDADQRKYQSFASLAFVRGIHRDRWIPRTKGQLRGKCFHLMTSSCTPHYIATTKPHIFEHYWNAITHPCSNFNGLTKPPLKF